jgi:capsular exopolysaccharide synthesis family protein
MGHETQGVPTVVDAELLGAVQPHVVILSAPRSAAAEQYRVLRQRIERVLATGVKRIGITSSVAGEGKTTTAVNLALALGLGRRHKVVLVDAHVRAPGVHKLLGMQGRAGLVDVVEERLGLDATLWRFRSDDLYVLPAGETLEPHAVVAARRMGAILAELSARFDAVIVDGPPILPTADMLTLGPELDGILVVVRAGRTPREVLANALDAMPDARMLGCVLHRVEGGVGAAWRLLAQHDRQARRALPAPKTVVAK